MDDDVDEQLLAAIAANLRVVTVCGHPGCDEPRGLGRRRFCDEHAAERLQESKNRWWRQHGADWRDRRAA